MKKKQRQQLRNAWQSEEPILDPWFVYSTENQIWTADFLLDSGLGCFFTAEITKLPLEIVIELALEQLDIWDTQRPIFATLDQEEFYPLQ